MITRGTSHFVSYTAACDYYRPYGFDHHAVQQKFRAGEIRIGAPQFNRATEELALTDGGKRYVIRDYGFQWRPA